MQLQGLSAADLLRFWRDIEFFNPFDLDEVIESSDLVTMVPLALDQSRAQQLQQSFAWAISSSEHGRDPEYVYAHDFYFAPFLKSEVRSKIYERFGPEALESIPEYREAHGLSCIGRMVIDDKGKLLLGNIKLSTLAWALDRLLNEQSLSLEMFDEYVKTLVSDLQECSDCFLKSEEKGSTTPEQSVIGLVPHGLLKILSERVIVDSQLKYFPNNLLGVIVSYQVKKRRLKADGTEETEENNILEYDLELLLRKKRRVDILNSFCLSDLERAFNTSAVHTSGSALYLYLRGLSGGHEVARHPRLSGATSNPEVHRYSRGYR